MFARYASAISTSTFMTFSLLYVMQLLISMQPGVMSDKRPGIGVNWIGKFKPLPPPPPPSPVVDVKDLTKVLPQPIRGNYSGEGTPVYFPMGDPPPPDGFTFNLSEFVDGPLVILIRVSPTYPLDAERRELAGHVIVQFDVMANGYVANVTVIESSNRIFESAAIKAAERFKYKPQVVDGVPQMSPGIQYLFRFEMEI